MTELAKLNPKRVISEYFDSFINRIDIHTQEQLAKFSFVNEIISTSDHSKCAQKS